MAYTYELNPKGKFLFIKEQIQEGEDKVGGIIIPKRSRTKQTALVVVYAGPDCVLHKPGDIVIPDARECRRAEVGGESFIVVEEDHIMGFLQEKEVND